VTLQDKAAPVAGGRTATGSAIALTDVGLRVLRAKDS
jgi:hypothetical protein